MEGGCCLVDRQNAKGVDICGHTLEVGWWVGGRVEEMLLLRTLQVLARLLQALVHRPTAAIGTEASYNFNCSLRAARLAVNSMRHCVASYTDTSSPGEAGERRSSHTLRGFVELFVIGYLQ